MKSDRVKLIELRIEKVIRKVMSETYSDDEDALQELILYAENDRRLYDIIYLLYRNL